MPELKDLFLPDCVVVKTNLSPDKQVLTTLVQNFQVSLDARAKPSDNTTLPVGRGVGDSPLVATQTASLYSTFGTSEQEAQIRVRIRGFVQLQKGAKATLVSRISGTTFTDDLACAADANGDYVLSHTLAVTPTSGVPVTMFLLLDRTLVDGGLPGGLATVEDVEFSLDLSTGSEKKS